MPIPKSSTAGGLPGGRQSALKLFTDRDHERRLLRNFFERLAHRSAQPEKPLLSIWGVGGIGKTSLLKKASEELGTDLTALRLIALDLDHDRWKPSSPVENFFWHLRSRFWEAKARGTAGVRGIETPTFDYLYFAHWKAQHPGEHSNLSNSVLQDVLKTFTEGSKLLAEVKELSSVKVGGIIGSGFQFLEKGLVLLRNRARKGLLSKRGLNPDTMAVKEMQVALSEMLAYDVEQWLEDHPNDALCVAIDGFERIQSTSPAENIQKFLADWCGRLTDPDATFAGRFGCVFLGRNKNRWDELYDKEWQTRISEHRICGLGEADARKFLESAAAHHEKREDLVRARNLRQHADAILAAAREQRSQEEPCSFHPYYLDLAYGILYDRGSRFQPTDLGQTPPELQICFLRYLQIGQPDVFQAFRCLALVGSFDKALFDHLVKRGCIAQGLHFAAITGEDYSYVEEMSDMPGTFRFHRLMELALIKNQSAKTEDGAVAREHIKVILKYLEQEAAFSRIAECTPSHVAAYQKGMTIAFERHQNGFIDFETLDSFFAVLEKAYDWKAFASARIGWWRELSELWKQRPPENERSLYVLFGVSALMLAQGPDGEAEALMREVLQARQRVLGAEHPDVAESLNGLAVLCYEQGRFNEAESLHEGALQIRKKELRPEHPDMAQSLYNLALLYTAQGRYTDAEPPYKRALRIWERALGPDHPDVAQSLNSLAALYSYQGRHDEAEPLLKRALAICEKALGPEHPDVARALNGLGRSTPTRAATATPSRSMSGRFESGKGRWVRTTPT